MNILFYTPTNNVSRDLESLALEASKHGHKIFLLIQNSDGPLAHIFRKHGFVVNTTDEHRPPGFSTILPLIFELIRFCRKNKIDIVYSYLEPTNLIAVAAQYFISAKVIIYRHHTDAAHLDGFDRSMAYRLTYKLAKQIIVVSEASKKYIVEHEGIPASKIHHIDLGYDFSLFNVPANISRSANKITLTIAGRLTAYKRPELALSLLKDLLKRDQRFHLVILGDGDMKNSLDQMIKEDHLEDHVTMKGYVIDVLPYLAISDFLVHPSVSESSCVTVKEAGLVNLPVIVCKGIGDFDEVLENDVDGWLVNKDNFVVEAAAIITQQTEEKKRAVGTSLKRKILDKFSIKRTFPLHEKLVRK